MVEICSISKILLDEYSKKIEYVWFYILERTLSFPRFIL